MYSRRWAEYDPKSFENLWGIVEKMSTVVFFDPNKSCTYAVNFFHNIYEKVIYCINAENSACPNWTS